MTKKTTYAIGIVAAIAYGITLIKLDITGWNIVYVHIPLVIVLLFYLGYQKLELTRIKYYYPRELFRRRTIFIRGEIDPGMARTILMQIKVLNFKDSKRPIKILIDSEGGSIEALKTILNSIKASIAPVDGIVVGSALSAAVSILQVCRNRYSLPYSSFLVHNPRSVFGLTCMDEDSYMTEGECDNFLKFIAFKIGQIKEFLKNSKELCSTLILQRTGMTEEKFKEIENIFLTTKEALKLNLIDKIVNTF